MSRILTVTDSSFEKEVINNTLPVLLDFWAPWCSPCVRMNPILVEIAEEFSDKIVVAKLDVQDYTEVPARYGIVSIPTLMLFHKGKKIAEAKGSRDKEALAEWLRDHL